MGQHSDRFHVQVAVGEHGVDVRAVGEVDIATVAALRSALWAAPARAVLRLDLSGVRLLSAAGVRALVAAHVRLRAQGGQLVLVDPDPVVARVLRVTGLHRVVPIVQSANSSGSQAPALPAAGPAVVAPAVAAEKPRPTPVPGPVAPARRPVLMAA
ncbi:STAS domain-containing protein [Micromonospora sp. URMC 103]|uniref:STAS domain-containing protein n=1 Tax=Micromonospora sp. URMC 103 TaxID=3423406 RepID=UPI003F1A3BF1